MLLALTAHGRRIVAKVTSKRRAEIAKIVTGMPNIQRTELVAALRAFADAAGELDPQPESAENLGW